MAFLLLKNAFFCKFGTLHIKKAQNRYGVYYLAYHV